MSGFAHSGGNSGMGGNAGGMSAGHMSSEGASNTNSPLAGDRNLGRARASDRSTRHAHTQLSSHSKKGKALAEGREI
jgi:hypothetical protein